MKTIKSYEPEKHANWIYNNHETIQKVIEDCISHTEFPIVVIDDGSDEPVVIPNASSTRVRVVRHPKNLGKGKAIQTAFQFALDHDYTHLMMMDGDGQHLVSEVPKMIKAAKENPWDLILGNRKLARVA